MLERLGGDLNLDNGAAPYRVALLGHGIVRFRVAPQGSSLVDWIAKCKSVYDPQHHMAGRLPWACWRSVTCRPGGLPARPQTIDRLLRMTAAVHGQLLNLSQLGASLGLSHPTVRAYLDHLEGAFLVRRLQPYAANLKKRLAPRAGEGVVGTLTRSDTAVRQPTVGLQVLLVPACSCSRRRLGPMLASRVVRCPNS
jgi:hypothetical protein